MADGNLPCKLKMLMCQCTTSTTNKLYLSYLLQGKGKASLECSRTCEGQWDPILVQWPEVFWGFSNLKWPDTQEMTRPRSGILKCGPLKNQPSLQPLEMRNMSLKKEGVMSEVTPPARERWDWVLWQHSKLPLLSPPPTALIWRSQEEVLGFEIRRH